MDRRNPRKYPRVGTTFRVECAVADETFHCKASMLGGGGLFIATQRALATGTEVLTRFRPAKHLPQIEAGARVRYSLPGQGVALEFINISPDHRHLLLRLIHHKKADRRRFPRAPLAIQIHCQDSMSLGFSRDVGEGGMFIETKEPLLPGSRLNLRFNLDDGGSVVLAVAEVTYTVSKLGMGVQFVDVSLADRKRIEAYVAKCQLAPQATSKSNHGI